MANNPRRRFLKASAGMVSGLALGACADEQAAPPATAPAGLDRPTLDALARLALPKTALGDAGMSTAVDGFLAWLEGFEPVAELDHGYDTSDVRYGPPDPAPLWQSQLEALNLEARKRFAVAWPELDESRQREILERQLPANLPVDLPFAAATAAHVAIGLMAWFHATPEANDLAHQANIGRESCRGLASGVARPAPLKA